jgi:signal transduction histidine kinase
MTYLTEGLLALVRTGSDPLRASFASFSVYSVAEAVIERMQPLAQARSQTLTLREIDRTASVFGNSEHIKQVLIILVDNAIKYSGNKTEISVDVIHAKSFASLIVEDTGKGIAKRKQKQIFKRYTRGKETVKGTGLGLSIAAKIVEAHDGTLRVTSRLGKGARFIVQIPNKQTGLATET